MSSKYIDRAKLIGFSAGWSAVRHLPDRAAYGMFRVIADAAWRRRGPSIRRLEANLARAAKDDVDLRALTREGVRSYFRYWCDAFRMADWSRERIVTRVRTINEDALRQGIENGRGAIAALPHMGNWDHAGAWACLEISPLATVAERLEPEELFEKFVAFRESLGMTVLPLTGGGVNVTSALAEHLTGGGLVCLPADRDLSGKGVPVTLLGEQTRMPAGPAMLAVRTGATLVPTTLWYEGREPNHTLVLRFDEPITPPAAGNGRIAAMTQQLADVFSARIAEHPADWHMMQRQFLSDLRPDDPRRTADQASQA